MPKYIDAEVAKRAIVEAVDAGLASHSDDLAEIIDELPATKVVPVRHGRWKKIGKAAAIYLCTACNKTYPHACDYCPNCGAKMD